jgi:predicted RNA binding protein YcfA (HicA-like mRNA interferase family)
MMRSFFNFKSNIYSVVSRGNRTVLPTKILPKSCSTQTLIKIFQSRGYSIVQGGKGSHVKLRNAVGETMIIPGNRKDLSIGVLNSALKSIGLSIEDLSTLGG